MLNMENIVMQARALIIIFSILVIGVVLRIHNYFSENASPPPPPKTQMRA